MELNFKNIILLTIIIYTFSNYILMPICKCILECYKIKHSVFRIKEDEKPKDFQDVDYR